MANSSRRFVLIAAVCVLVFMQLPMTADAQVSSTELQKLTAQDGAPEAAGKIVPVHGTSRHRFETARASG